jgi:hypothetical protein
MSKLKHSGNCHKLNAESNESVKNVLTKKIWSMGENGGFDFVCTASEISDFNIHIFYINMFHAISLSKSQREVKKYIC